MFCSLPACRWGELTGRAPCVCGQVLSAVTALRYLPGLDPESDLRRIRAVVNKALCAMLRLCPLIFQYSVTETVRGDRDAYPDLSRIRYLMKKVRTGGAADEEVW